LKSMKVNLMSSLTTTITRFEHHWTTLSQFWKLEWWTDSHLQHL
jgi:hypothetical protein